MFAHGSLIGAVSDGRQFLVWCLEAPYGVGLKRGGSGSGVYVRFRGKDGMGALSQLQAARSVR